MTLSARMLAYLAAGLACVPASCWAQADALKHDPFARPALVKAAPPPIRAGDTGGAGKATLPEPDWKPELGAVMVAGPKSAVNIDGAIIRIGEVINGHRLAEVHEQSAVFVKNGKRVTLSLRGMQLAPAARPEALPKQAAPPKPEEK